MNLKKVVLSIALGASLMLSIAVAAQSFTDNGDGTVTDNVTGLIWQKEDDNTTRTWEGALTYCEGLSLGGQTDWRLPNVNELQSIVDYSVGSPAIATAYFPGADSSNYWSSTTIVYDASRAWYVDFNNGRVSAYGKSSFNYVRCVRGGQ